MIQTYEEALQNIFTIESMRDYSLEKVKRAIQLLGNPLQGIKVIHVAGTNGKGSVVRMVYQVLKRDGKKVGMFTSPHLIDIRERFVDQNGEISKGKFVEKLNIVLSLPFELSYFEKCFLIAILFFRDNNLEYVVIEVGMGGLLDATNVVIPCITAISSIGLDHTEILGNTIEEIAYQKAGIIKEGVPIVYNQENKIIEEIALQKDSPILFTRRMIQTNVFGSYQQKNAAIAFEICKYLGMREDIIYEGLMEVSNYGRLQYLQRNLLLDGAHNIDGMRELKKYIDSISINFDKVQLCISLKKGKNIKVLLDIFGINNDYIIVENDTHSTENAFLLQKQFIDSGVQSSVINIEEIEKKVIENENHLYVVFGSLYMIGDFLKNSQSFSMN